MKNVSYSLTRFPCGCTIEGDQPVFEQNGCMECPWCLATFMFFEYNEWAEEFCAPFLIGHPAVLISVGEKLLEILHVCGDCEKLVVRERPGMKNFHLDAPADQVSFLSN